VTRLGRPMSVWPVDAELLSVAQVPHETNLPKMPVGGSGSDDGDATALEVDVVDPTRQVPNTCGLCAEEIEIDIQRRLILGAGGGCRRPHAPGAVLSYICQTTSKVKFPMCGAGGGCGHSTRQVRCVTLCHCNHPCIPKARVVNFWRSRWGQRLPHAGFDARCSALVNRRLGTC